MRFVLVVLVVLTSFHSFTQEWRDSLVAARSFYNKGDYQKALKYYNSAQKKAPKSVDLSDEMGQTAYKAREFERAEKIYNQSGSKLNKSKKAKTYHNIGNSRMQQKNYQGAIDAYKESLKNNPNDNETRYNLSEAIRRLNDQQKKDKDNKKNKDQQKNQNNNKKNNNKNQQNSNNKNNESNSNKNNQQNKSKLPNKAVDRILDQLAKKEAETKKKTASRKGDNLGTVSGKDW